MSQLIYTAAILIIGNEILTGRTQDSNVSYIAERLTDKGIHLVEVRVVRDEEDEIIKAVNDLRSQFHYVFTSGGIGPTHDDITAAAVAKAFGVALLLNEDAKQMLGTRYKQEELNTARLKMAHIPEGAVLIENPVSAAPGFKIGNVFVMAGVPRIMQAMLDGIIDGLAGGRPMLSNTVSCFLREGLIADRLEAIQKNFPDVSIGSYPHYRGSLSGLSFVLRSVDLDSLTTATEAVVQMVRDFGSEPQAMSLRDLASEG